MAEKKLKIALIDPVGGHGGMDYYDYGLAHGLSANNVIVFYFTGSDTTVREYRGVTTVGTFGGLWSMTGIQKVVRLANGYLKSFRIARKNGCRHAHFQFFHFGIQNVCALCAAKIVGLKRIVTVHDVDSFRKKEISFLQKVGYGLSNEIIVHNQLSKDELQKKNHDLKNIHIIPHGNYKLFVQELVPRQNDGVLKLLFFGQIKDVKGLELLLYALKKALQETKKVHLTIAGKTWANENYDYPSLISELGLYKYVTTRFEFIPDEQVSSYFQDSDVVVLPYKRIYQSGVLLLAMSYGRTVLASDLPAFKEIIRDRETGFLFENGNSDHLAKTILDLCDQDLLDRVRNNAKNLLEEKFDWTAIGKQTKKVYEST